MFQFFETFRNALEAVVGNVTHAYEIVSNNPSPAHRAPPPQAIAEPFNDRKRRNPWTFTPMSRIKRQDFGSQKSSPWSNEVWVLQHSADLHSIVPKQSDKQKARRPPGLEERLTRRKESRTRAGYCAWKSHKRPRPPFSKTLDAYHTSILQNNLNSWREFYSSTNKTNPPGSLPCGVTMPSKSSSSSTKNMSIHIDIEESRLERADFAPLSHPKRDSDNEGFSQASREESDANDTDDDDGWDKEGEADHRRLLRRSPESQGGAGLRASDMGIMISGTQAQNLAHQQKPRREAPPKPRTPSSPLKPDVSSQIPQSRSIPAGFTNAAENLSPDKIATPELTSLWSEETQPSSSSVGAVKDASKTPTIFLPLVEFEKLDLKRTPKSAPFTILKSERITRAQRMKAEREAAKNAYPIIPLSDVWDQRVRDAVNNGHGRFEARMFNKCVPEYSNDPSAGSLWLDDAVINDYVAMIAKHGSKDDRKTQVRSVAALSSFFYSKISLPSPDYPSCARMLKRAGIQGKNLLECEKVFIPINKSYHWTLAVIEPKVPEGLSPTDHGRKITIYNSMGSAGGQIVAGNILKWIQNELGASFKAEEWITQPAGKSPQQQNSDDCGVFAVTTARQIMLGKFSEKEMYKPDIISIQRKRIVAELVHGGLLSKDESQQ